MADPEFPRKIPKKYPSDRNSGTPRKYRKNTEKIPKKYRKNTEKIPKMRIFGILGVFFRYFRGILGVNSGSPEFPAGGYFFGIFRGNSGSGPISGLCRQVGAFSTSVKGRFQRPPRTKSELKVQRSMNAKVGSGFAFPGAELSAPSPGDDLRCDPSIPPEEFLGPSGPKLETELKMSSRDPPAPGGQKVKNGVEKESKKSKKS